MRFLPLLTCLFSLLGSGLSAQTIRGVITDGLTGAPIPFATVYVDGTTIGEVSDEDGRYSLFVAPEARPATLIVSHLNYHNGQSALLAGTTEGDFTLSPRAITTIAVEVKDQNQRAENLAEFRELFLGTDAWGRRARIRDESPLVFTRNYATKTIKNARRILGDRPPSEQTRKPVWSADGQDLTFEKATDLSAYGRSQLEIDLPDLGYVLYADLNHFLTDYQRGTTNRVGTYYWQPYESRTGKKVRPRHRKNRERAYYNSRLHFLRALYRGELAAEGYAIYEKKGKEVFEVDPASYLRPLGNDEMALTGLKGRVFVILYYGDQRGRPLPDKKWKRANPVQSELHVVGDPALIRADGTTGDTPLLFGGLIGSRRIAWMLPNDYRVEGDL